MLVFADTWTGGGADDLFSTDGNWLSGTAPANPFMGTLTFTQAGSVVNTSEDATVLLDQDRVVGGFLFTVDGGTYDYLHRIDLDEYTLTAGGGSISLGWRVNNNNQNYGHLVFEGAEVIGSFSATQVGRGTTSGTVAVGTYLGILDFRGVSAVDLNLGSLTLGANRGAVGNLYFGDNAQVQASTVSMSPQSSLWSRSHLEFGQNSEFTIGSASSRGVLHMGAERETEAILTMGGGSRMEAWLTELLVASRDSNSTNDDTLVSRLDLSATNNSLINISETLHVGFIRQSSGVVELGAGTELVVGSESLRAQVVLGFGTNLIASGTLTIGSGSTAELWVDDMIVGRTRASNSTPSVGVLDLRGASTTLDANRILLGTPDDPTNTNHRNGIGFLHLEDGTGRVGELEVGNGIFLNQGHLELINFVLTVEDSFTMVSGANSLVPSSLVTRVSGKSSGLRILSVIGEDPETGIVDFESGDWTIYFEDPEVLDGSYYYGLRWAGDRVALLNSWIDADRLVIDTSGMSLFGDDIAVIYDAGLDETFIGLQTIPEPGVVAGVLGLFALVGVMVRRCR